MTPRKPKPPARTKVVRAWAIMCEIQIHEIALTLFDARDELTWMRNYSGDYMCGPHTVVALTGRLPGNARRVLAQRGKESK